MKHAFLITAYTDENQLHSLIQSLQSPFSSIYIHVDRKSTLSLEDLRIQYKTNSHVRFIDKPIRVFWGGFSHLQSFLILMKEAFKTCDADYFHTISGQDFPIIPVDRFAEVIRAHKKREFLSCATFEALNWTGGSANRLQLYHLNDCFNIRRGFWKRINTRFLQLQCTLKIKRKLPAAFQHWYGGGTWWSLSRNAIDYILNFIHQNPHVLRAFKKTHCSEEIFFQTILMNSVFAENVAYTDLRYVDWNFRNGSVPAVLDESDFEKIISSGKLFARKTESKQSELLVKKLLRHHESISAKAFTREVSEKF